MLHATAHLTRLGFLALLACAGCGPSSDHARPAHDGDGNAHAHHGPGHGPGAAVPAHDGWPAKGLAVGDKVPDLVLVDLAEKRWNLAELQKRTPSGVVCLTFWCTFCHSCRTMDARFQELADSFGAKAAIIGVDASAADSAKKVEDFRTSHGLSVPIFMDTEGTLADLFGVEWTTTTIVLDAKGVIRYRGQFDGPGVAYAKDALESVLAGEPVAIQETKPAG